MRKETDERPTEIKRPHKVDQQYGTKKNTLKLDTTLFEAKEMLQVSDAVG